MAGVGVVGVGAGWTLLDGALGALLLLLLLLAVLLEHGHHMQRLLHLRRVLHPAHPAPHRTRLHPPGRPCQCAPLGLVRRGCMCCQGGQGGGHGHGAGGAGEGGLAAQHVLHGRLLVSQGQDLLHHLHLGVWQQRHGGARGGDAQQHKQTHEDRHGSNAEQGLRQGIPNQPPGKTPRKMKRKKYVIPCCYQLRSRTQLIGTP